MYRDIVSAIRCLLSYHREIRYCGYGNRVYGLYILGIIPLGAQELKKDTLDYEGRMKMVSYTKGQWLDEFNAIDTLHHESFFFHADQLKTPFVRYTGYAGQQAVQLEARASFIFDQSYGLRDFDYYRYTLENTRRFKSKAPYSSLNYILGSPQHQLFHLVFAHHIKRKWFYNMDYRRLTSPGPYKRNKAGVHNFHFMLWNISENRKYEAQYRFIYNALKQEENGGISYLLFEDQYRKRSLINIKLSDAIRRQQDQQFYTVHSYNFLRTDTTNRDAPAFKAGVYAQYMSEQYAYKDVNIPDDYYTNIYYNNSTASDTALDLRWRYGARIWLTHFLRNRLQLSAGINGEKMLFEQSMNVTDLERWQFRRATHYWIDAIGNLTMGREKQIIINGFYKQSLAGIKAGDHHLKTKLQWNLPFIWVLAGYEQMLKTPDWIYSQNLSNFHIWSMPEGEKRNRSFGYELEGSIGLYKLPISLYIKEGLKRNGLYFSGLQEPLQSEVIWHYNQFKIQGEFTAGDIHIIPQLIYQIHNGISMPWPALLSRITTYWQRSLLRKATTAHIGINLQYTSAYKPWKYSPSLGTFYFNNTVKLPAMPCMDFFAQFTIKNALLFFRLNFINQGWPQWGYYSLPDMPGQDRNFEFGLRWDFVD